MIFIRSLKMLATAAFLIGAVATGGYVYREMWLPNTVPDADEPATSMDETTNASNKIVIGEQAQKNLGLTAKPLKADIFWKTITVPGMVVDRPGVSDRQIVAPAVGVIDRIWHVPGDIVHEGDVLFTFRLTSDPLHETQAELYKAIQDIQLARARRKRLESAGAGIPGSRLIEVESEIKRLEVTVEANRSELLSRGLSAEDVRNAAEGRFIKEIPIKAPSPVPAPIANRDSPSADSDSKPAIYELQDLRVKSGQQVQAGEALCDLSNHQLLAIEGRAFRDETLLLEGSIREHWPVEVDFQEAGGAGWPATSQSFYIQYLANTIDPATRTFSFLMPLDNQSQTVVRENTSQLIWRFRPGQKVRLNIRVEKLQNVFVLPADAVVHEGPEAFVFTQNVNTFEQKPIHVVFRNRDWVVIANDGSLPTYKKGEQYWTIPAVVRNAAAQLNRMTKAGSSSVPKGFHVHADGSLHKNEDEGK